MRLIDADVLNGKMYRDAFDTDSNMQKWDSGCWIRYKMVEKNINNAPTVDAVPVVRCKDCVYSELWKPALLWCRMFDIHTEEEGYCWKAKPKEMKNGTTNA